MKKTNLLLNSWADDVKKAVNDLIDLYGGLENAYAVFDFDNTSSIFDVGEQLAIYQLDNMCFGFTPNEIEAVLSSGLGDMDRDLSHFGYGKGSYRDWITDIKTAYTYLYRQYGPFCAKEVEDEKLATLHSDEMWLEFAAKMRAMYDLIGDNESTDVSYPWILYWYTGLTADEVYELAMKSHRLYRDYPSEAVALTSPSGVKSLAGVVTADFTKGITVTDNTRELWHALKENGIDVWVCSASQLDVIRAAVDYFGLHDDITGITAMTIQEKSGVFCPKYDYETGYPVLAVENSGWIKTEHPNGAQTQGKGKVVTIENTLFPRYGVGPIAGFMDSTGDFNFCTEFSSLKLVVCFNRLRKSTDGGGLIAEVAMYQKDELGYTLASANQAGDTLYVLQGRDENDPRCLRNGNATVALNQYSEKLFADERNQEQLRHMTDAKMTTADALNTLSRKETNSCGFLKEYDGYHSH